MARTLGDSCMQLCVHMLAEGGHRICGDLSPTFVPDADGLDDDLEDGDEDDDCEDDDFLCWTVHVSTTNAELVNCLDCIEGALRQVGGRKTVR